MIHQSNSSMCTCPSHYYKTSGNCYSKYIYIYIECNECCIECTGPTNKECKPNNCNNEDTCYPLYQQNATTCLQSCISQSPLFLEISVDGKICKDCHKDCKFCFGETNEKCLECKSPYLLKKERECKDIACDINSNTFQSPYYKCENCSERCDECQNNPNYCLECISPYVFLSDTHSCLFDCPSYYYEYNRKCLSNLYIYIYIVCPYHCIKCTRTNFTNMADETPENFICLECENNYFLNQKQICVAGNDCGETNYPELLTKTCKLCNEVCQGCNGPLESDCISCHKDYVFYQGICQTFSCQSDEYLDKELFMCLSKLDLYLYIINLVIRMP